MKIRWIHNGSPEPFYNVEIGGVTVGELFHQELPEEDFDEFYVTARRGEAHSEVGPEFGLKDGDTVVATRRVVRGD